MRVHALGGAALLDSDFSFQIQNAGFELKLINDLMELPRAIGPADTGALLLGCETEDPSQASTLRAVREQFPVVQTVVISRHGSIPLAVACMKEGAVDFMTMPVAVDAVLQRIQESVQTLDRRQRIAHDQAQVAQRLSRLTERERELVKLICNGLSNKQIASRLDISIKTVENHRAHLMHKTRANNAADMVRLALTAELADCRQAGTEALAFAFSGAAAPTVREAVSAVPRLSVRKGMRLSVSSSRQTS